MLFKSLINGQDFFSPILSFSHVVCSNISLLWNPQDISCMILDVETKKNSSVKSESTTEFDWLVVVVKESLNNCFLLWVPTECWYWYTKPRSGGVDEKTCQQKMQSMSESCRTWSKKTLQTSSSSFNHYDASRSCSPNQSNGLSYLVCRKGTSQYINNALCFTKFVIWACPP